MKHKGRFYINRPSNQRASVKLVKFSKLEVTFLSGVLAASLCVLIFIRLNLTHTSQQAIEQFSQQNRFELASGDTMQLATKLNALMASESVQCVQGVYRKSSFVSSSKGSCRTGVLAEQMKVDTSTAEGLEIFITYKMPNLLIYSALILLITQFLVVLIFFKIYSDKINLTLAAKEQFASLASQVSHDIRSPLTALDMVLGDIGALPEDKRIMARNATQRIKDIANNLLQHSKSNSNSDKVVALKSNLNSAPTVQLISSMLEVIVSEKRTQFRERPGIEVDLDLTEGGYGLFASIDLREIKRIISNLINNSVEAMGDKDIIRIQLDSPDSNSVRIRILDNGKGIPPEVLAKLGNRGVTHGKEGAESGSGLGIYHAKTTIESCGGKFLIDSVVGQGTTISIILPRTKVPSWFVEKIEVEEFSSGQKYRKYKIVVLDDDVSIHQIWTKRFSSALLPVELVHFSSPEEFSRWAEAGNKADRYLFDYELLGHKETGLDVVERFGLKEKAILVTSRFELPSITARCEANSVGLIPKGLAPIVPIVKKVPKEFYDAIVIDDDDLVHLTWNVYAKDNSKTLACFKTVEAFITKSQKLDLKCPIYIDSNLGNEVKGEEVAKKIFDAGFSIIYLATGFEPSSFPKFSHILKVVGKEPNF